MELNTLNEIDKVLFVLNASKNRTEQELKDIRIFAEENGKGHLLSGECSRYFYVKFGDIIELKSGVKSNDILPYYDMEALRNIDNPNWIPRNNFKFTKSKDKKKNVNIKVDYNLKRVFIDKGNIAEKGDYLLSSTGTIGDVFIMPEKGYITPSLKIIKLKYDLISLEFLRYWIKSNKDKLVADKKGVYVPNLNKQKLEEMIIPIPSKIEQEMIVNKLDLLLNAVDSMGGGLC